jgi:hypothetical protein
MSAVFDTDSIIDVPASPTRPVYPGIGSPVPEMLAVSSIVGHTVGASVQVTTWIEARMREPAASSVKQRLAALQRPFNWLVNGQRLGRSDQPAHTVHGPRTS